MIKRDSDNLTPAKMEAATQMQDIAHQAFDPIAHEMRNEPVEELIQT